MPVPDMMRASRIHVFFLEFFRELIWFCPTAGYNNYIQHNITKTNMSDLKIRDD